MTNPWESKLSPWAKSTQFFTYLRGCLRKAWTHHPLKRELIKRDRKQIPNPNLRGKKETVWGAECSMCQGEFVLKDIQVDHIVPAGSLTCKEDIQGFVERLLWVTEDDLRIVCKECNSALAYSDKHNMSYEEAKVIKKAIKTVSKPVSEQLRELEGYGYTREQTSNEKKRRACYEEVYRKEMEG